MRSHGEPARCGESCDACDSSPRHSPAASVRDDSSAQPHSSWNKQASAGISARCGMQQAGRYSSEPGTVEQAELPCPGGREAGNEADGGEDSTVHPLEQSPLRGWVECQACRKWRLVPLATQQAATCEYWECGGCGSPCDGCHHDECCCSMAGYVDGGVQCPSGFRLEVRYRDGSMLPWLQYTGKCGYCGASRSCDRRTHLETFLSQHRHYAPWANLQAHDFTFSTPREYRAVPNRRSHGPRATSVRASAVARAPMLPHSLLLECIDCSCFDDAPPAATGGNDAEAAQLLSRRSSSAASTPLTGAALYELLGCLRP